MRKPPPATIQGDAIAAKERLRISPGAESVCGAKKPDALNI